MRKIKLNKPNELQGKLFDFYKRARVDWHSYKFNLEYLNIRIEDGSIALELGPDLISKNDVYERFFVARLFFVDDEVYISVRPSSYLIFASIITMLIIICSSFIQIEFFYFSIVYLLLFSPFIIYKGIKGYVNFNKRLDRFFDNI